MKKFNLFKTFGVILFAMSCQPTEDFVEETKNAKFTTQVVEFSEIKVLNRAAYETLKTYDAKLNNETQRGLSANNTYQIEQARVRIISNQNGYTSFTIPVVQPDKKLIQNLVFSQYKNGTSRITLNEYVLDREYYAIDDSTIKSHILDSKVYDVNNPNLLTSRGTSGTMCIAIGYYETVDKCEGELVTPSRNPECFNADGTRATREIFISIAEDCSDSGGSGDDDNSNPPNGPTGPGNNGGLFDNGGGDGDLGGNNFEGDNFDGVATSPNGLTTGFSEYQTMASNVSQYLSSLSSFNTLFGNQQNTTLKNAFFYTITNFAYQNGGLTNANKAAIAFAMNQITAIVNTNHSNWTNNEIVKFNTDILSLVLNRNSLNQNFVNHLLSFIPNNQNFTVKNYNLILNDIEFFKEIFENISNFNYSIPNYTMSNYPGRNQNLPYDWWNNTDLTQNFKLSPSDNLNLEQDLTDEEKVLCALFPAAALTIKNNVQPAFDMTSTKFPGQMAYNNKPDAFRHGFFNAINTRDVVIQAPITGGIPIPARIIVRWFGQAHEASDPAPPALEVEMDLWNNDRGIYYCSNCYPLLNSNNDIAENIIQLMANGQLKYLHPLGFDNQVISTTQIIPTNQ